MGEALLEGFEGGFDRGRIGVRDVAPHRKWTGAEARHFTQGAAPDLLEFRRVAHLVFEKELSAVAVNCGRWLTQASSSS